MINYRYVILFIISLILFLPRDTLTQTNSVDLGPYKEMVSEHIIKLEMQKLVTTSLNNSYQSSASYDFAKSEVKLNTSFFLNSNIYEAISISLSGSSTDGTLALIKNTKFNSSFSLGVKYNNIDSVSKEISFEPIEFQKFKTDKRILEGKRQKQIIKLKKVNDSLNSVIKRNQDLKDSLTENIPVGTQNYNNLIDSITNLYDGIIYSDEYSYETNDIIIMKLEYDSDIEKAEQLKALEAIKNVGYDINWFSVEYLLTNNSFKLLHRHRSIDSQIVDNSNLLHKVVFTLNSADKDKVLGKTSMLTYLLGISSTSNFNSLKKKHIIENSPVNENDGSRSIVEEYDVYEGSYKTSILNLELGIDYISFWDKLNLGTHIYLSHNVYTKLEPLTNVGFGLLYSFADAKKKGSDLNLELFLELEKVNDKYNIGELWSDKSTVGVRLSVPFILK